MQAPTGPDAHRLDMRMPLDHEDVTPGPCRPASHLLSETVWKKTGYTWVGTSGAPLCGMGMVDFAFGVAAILSVVAIVDPPGVIAPFLVLTEGLTKEEKRRVIANSCLVATITLGIFALFGEAIFAVFNFTIPAFKIAGGALLFVTAFQMTQGVRSSRTRITEKRDEEAEAVGIVPLGIPLLAGPGAITTVLIYMTRRTPDALDKTFVFVGILVAVLATFLLLRSADLIYRRVGRTGTIAFGRIMGLLLAAVGVQFILDGIVDAARAVAFFP